MNETEASAMYQQVGSAHGLVEFAGAANPNQAGELYAGRFSRGWMELIMGIDNRGNFAAPGGCSQDMQETGCTAGGARADNLSYGSAA